MAVVLASTAVGCGGVSEEGPEPTTEVDGLASVDDLETDETSLFWASGEIGRVSFGGGATRLGGESVCDVESNGEWLYYLDGGAGGFVAADSGGLDVDEPTLVVTNVSVSGRTPRCGTLALTPTQAFLVVAAFGDESQMLNAPLGDRCSSMRATRPRSGWAKTASTGASDPLERTRRGSCDRSARTAAPSGRW